MSMNEADTRYHLIAPVLRDKGYVSRNHITLETILTPAPVEPSGAKGRRRKGPGRTDYLLCVQVREMPEALPVAVLEARKESEDPLKGMQQAKGYADCERFDVKYVFATNGHRYGEFDYITSLQGGPLAVRKARTHRRTSPMKCESPYSWTVDFAARRVKARAETQPLLEDAAQIKATVVDLKEQLKRRKKDKASDVELLALTTKIQEKEKAARDLETQASAIDAAVFDLKAVNPTAVVDVDTRTLQQIIGNIETQGRIVADALARLNTLMAASEVPE